METGSLETLKRGQTLLTVVKPVNYSDPNKPKVQIELAEFVQDPNRPVNALAAFNADDDRFSGKPRRGWLTVSPAMLENLLGIDVDKGTYDGSGVEQDVNMLNPAIDGNRLHIQITETVSPDEYQASNVETTAKRAGAEGPFITHEGNYIFSNTTIVVGEPQHTFLKSDGAPIGEGISAPVAAGVSALSS